MRNISDIIEHFLKQAIELSEDGSIEVQRSSLAEKFQCVPSQINYVIGTRFSFEKGFLVESKRGGGGYIRIKKLEIKSDYSFYETLSNAIDDEVDQSTANDLLGRLFEENYLSHKEFEIIKAIMTREVLNLPLPTRDIVRANILRTMLKVIFSK